MFIAGNVGKNILELIKCVEIFLPKQIWFLFYSDWLKNGYVSYMRVKFYGKTCTFS